MSLHELQTRVHVRKDKRKPSNGSLAKWIEENARLDTKKCVKWPFSFSANGYPGNTLWAGKQMFGHRAMCIAAHGQQPKEKPHAAHTCGNRWCINPNHLRWASISENQMDRVRHNTSNRGENHGLAKLTEVEVMQIFCCVGTQTEIAEKFGVTRRTVSDIKNGKTWAWLTGGVK